MGPAVENQGIRDESKLSYFLKTIHICIVYKNRFHICLIV